MPIKTKTETNKAKKIDVSITCSSNSFEAVMAEVNKLVHEMTNGNLMFQVGEYDPIWNINVNASTINTKS